jgi:hypothetical protein
MYFEGLSSLSSVTTPMAQPEKIAVNAMKKGQEMAGRLAKAVLSV